MTAGKVETRSARFALLRNRNFRFLWIGGTISNFGDQFYLIALPWLVLVISGNNALALGSILAAAAVPRVVFMAFGGVATDRISPRLILIVSASTRALLVGLLAVLVLTGLVELWMIFCLAITFGFADAFAAPAAQTLLPRIVAPEELAPGNALVSGAFQIAGILGPASAGLLIAFFGSDLANTTTDASRTGIGAAFVFDAMTFVVVAISMWVLKLPGRQSDNPNDQQGVLKALGEGLRFVLAHPGYRAMLILAAIMNLALNGPAAIGLPVMARTEFPGGAASLGLLMSAMAAGSLLGYAFGGSLPRPEPRRFGTVIMICAASGGVFFIGLAVAPGVKLAMASLFVSSTFNAYTNILLITWFQQSAPPHLLGRTLGIVMTVTGGLAPVSMAVAGVLIEVFDVRLVLGVASGLMAFVGFSGLLFRSVRMMDAEPGGGQ